MMMYTLTTGPLWPAYTDAYTRGDYNWMQMMRKKMQKVLMLSILGCFVIALLSSPIYHIWIGDAVSIPYEMTMMVAIYVAVYCWMNLNGTLLVGMGKIQIETFMAFLGMIVHLPFSLFLGKYLGAYGVLTSLIVINIVYALIMNIQVKKILNKNAYGIWNQ